MLYFTSFAIVLTLGGGPKYTTLEVAIYQAILFEFDVPKAGLFALLQFVFCFLLFTLSSFFLQPPPRHYTVNLLGLRPNRIGLNYGNV